MVILRIIHILDFLSLFVIYYSLPSLVIKNQCRLQFSRIKLCLYTSNVESVAYSSNITSTAVKNDNYYQKFKKSKYSPMKRQLRTANVLDSSSITVSAVSSMVDIVTLAQKGMINQAFANFMNIYGSEPINSVTSSPQILRLRDCNMVYIPIITDILITITKVT